MLHVSFVVGAEGCGEGRREKALNKEDDPFASLNVEEDVMESLKDDLQMMKEKLHENYGMAAEEPVVHELIPFFGFPHGTKYNMDFTLPFRGR